MSGVDVERGESDEAHPEVFDIRAMPPQPKEKKPGQLPEHMIRQFFEQGYLVVDKFFTPEELEPCRKEIEGMVEELAQKLYRAGKIKDLYKDYGLFKRLTKIEEEFPGANVILHKVPNVPPAFRTLWSNDRLLNVIEQLIGPDIAGSPVWNLRTKTPQNEATTVPWHQDNGYLDNESYKVFIPTAWIPLLDAYEENGCLEVAERGHKTGRIGTHQCCWGGTWYVMLEEEEMEKKLEIDPKKDFKICPIPYGGMLLFSNAIPHRSLPNMSDDVRWSLDLRWQRPKDPCCLWGLKEPVEMRSSKHPDIKIDWTTFDSVSRHDKQKATVEDMNPTEGNDPDLDTTLPGPWMKKWELVHLNRHTGEFQRQEALANA